MAMHSHSTAVVVSIGVIDKTRMRSHGKNSVLQISTAGMLTFNLLIFGVLIRS